MRRTTAPTGSESAVRPAGCSFAWYFDDPNILLSRATSPARAGSCSVATSRIGCERSLPFLRLDRDPYMVISEGRLFWMQDAYTTSDWFPYAQPIPDGEDQLHPQLGQGRHRRLQRHSRLLCDGHGGSAGRRPTSASSRACSSRSPRCRRTCRSTSATRRISSSSRRKLYRAYHMDTPEVFYNREDLWQFPREPSQRRRQPWCATMAPYYMIMRLARRAAGRVRPACCPWCRASART